MNDYKSDEFRTAKYLRSGPVYAEYFNLHRTSLNKIGLGNWNNIEYVDELIDNPGKTIYYVSAGHLSLSADKERCNYAPAHIQILQNTVVSKGFVMPPMSASYVPATTEDIQDIEDDNGAGYYLLNSKYSAYRATDEPYIWSLHDMPIMHKAWVTYGVLFFEKEEANNYGICLTEYLRYNSDAISAISRYF